MASLWSLEGHPVLVGLSVHDNLAAAALMLSRRDADNEIEAALEIFPELTQSPFGSAHNFCPAARSRWW